MTNVVLLMRRVVKEVLVAVLPACFVRESIGFRDDLYRPHSAGGGKVKANASSVEKEEAGRRQAVASRGPLA